MNKIQQVGKTVYCLNDQGINYWSFFVDSGRTEEGKRTPEAVLRKVATKMAAVDDLYEALESAEKTLQCLVEEYPGHLKELHTVKAALAKARGDTQ
jgi:hypothetical protein